MNRAIERRLADKAREIACYLEPGEHLLDYDSLGSELGEVADAAAERRQINPVTGAKLLRLAMLITEYNTLQALQAEIDS